MSSWSQHPLIMSVRRRLKQNPHLRNAYHDLDILLKFKTLRPDRVRMAGSRHEIFIDAREARGRALLRSYCSGQPRLKSFWRRALRELRPTIVLDVGANYGEFLFLEDYAPGTTVVGIEANPALRPFLERSRALHPNRDDIELVSALAGESHEGEAAFYVDKQWSGRSSALRSHIAGAVESQTIGKTSIDALLAARCDATSRMLFKIDVEGYESFVLRGMAETLRRCGQMVGLLELDTRDLTALGIDLDEYVDGLRRHFALYAINPDGTARKLGAAPLASLFPGRTSFHTDVVLLSDPTLEAPLGLPSTAG